MTIPGFRFGPPGFPQPAPVTAPRGRERWQGVGTHTSHRSTAPATGDRRRVPGT